MREVLEKALIADPDDLATHSAYADYLLEQGDPRGEFILLQLQIERTEDEAEKKLLRKRARDLQSRHEEKWLGGLARILLGRGGEEFNYSFSRGWLHSLTIRELRLTVAETIARSPATSLLRELHILKVPRESRSRRKPFAALASSTRVVNLGWLRAAKFHDGDEVCRLLASTGKLKKLRRLSLTEGDIGAMGVNDLLASPDFAKLEALNLSENRIPGMWRDRIRKLLADAKLDPQSIDRPEIPQVRETNEAESDYQSDWE